MFPFPAIFGVELLADTLYRHAIREALQAGNDLDPPIGAPPSVDDAPRPVSPIHVSVERGQEALARASDEWSKGVREPPKKGWQRIDDYIRGDEGLDWPSAALHGSNDSTSYKRNGQFEWCGAFAAFCWGSLKRDIRFRRFASTYRLWTWAKGTPRMLTPKQARPGDILVVGRGNAAARGNHITIVRGGVEEQDGSVPQIKTIEGNATGLGPNSDTYEGVILRTRPLDAPEDRIYRALYVVRPLEEDLA